MNEELQKQLAEVVRKSLELAEKSGKFVIDQAPDILNEFYRWKIFDSILNIITAIFIFIAVRYVPTLWLSSEKREKDSWGLKASNNKFFNRYGEEGATVSWIIFCIGSFISFIIIICSIHTILFIAISPKMYLINYFLK